jgi:hypothetical protein
MSPMTLATPPAQRSPPTAFCTRTPTRPSVLRPLWAPVASGGVQFLDNLTPPEWVKQEEAKFERRNAEVRQARFTAKLAAWEAEAERLEAEQARVEEEERRAALKEGRMVRHATSCGVPVVLSLSRCACQPVPVTLCLSCCVCLLC